MRGLKNISIETITEGFVEKGAIIFNETIQYVGSIENLKEFNQAIDWMDGNGGVLFPGFIDVHTHLGIDEEGVGTAGDDFNEISNPVTPHLRVIDGINPFDSGYYQALNGGVTTVQVLPGSANVIGGLTAVLKVKPERTVEQQCIQFPAGLKIAFGENPKNTHQSIATRMGIAAKLRATFWQTVKSINDDPTSLEEEALQYVLKNNITIRAHAHRADDILTAIRIAKEFNLSLSIEHATDGIRILNEIKESGYQVVIGPTMTGKPKLELASQSWDTYRAFEQANIPFAITTDHPVVPIEALIIAVRNAIASGLSEKTAAEAVTIQAAKQLGLSDRLGSLTVGKDADFVLWSTHPLQDFKAQVVKVFIDGKEEKHK